jgi:hypothetical protein
MGLIDSPGRARLWVLEFCPFNPEHYRAAHVVQFASGAVAFGCFHTSCEGKDWAALRDLVEPEWHERAPNGAAKPVPWETPIPFDTLNLPRLSTEALPYWLRKFVEASQRQTPNAPKSRLRAGDCIEWAAQVCVRCSGSMRRSTDNSPGSLHLGLSRLSSRSCGTLRPSMVLCSRGHRPRQPPRTTGDQGNLPSHGCSRATNLPRPLAIQNPINPRTADQECTHHVIPNAFIGTIIGSEKNTRSTRSTMSPETSRKFRFWHAAHG